jgi:hypothetical protein
MPAGPLLRDKRKARGIALNTMAAWLHISSPYLLDLERGYRPLRPEVAMRYRTGLRRLGHKQPSVRPA